MIQKREEKAKILLALVALVMTGFHSQWTAVIGFTSLKDYWRMKSQRASVKENPA